MRAARSRTQGEEAQLCSAHGLVGTHQMQQLLPPHTPKHFPLRIRGAARARAAGKWGSSAAWGWFCGPEGKLGCQGGFKIFVLLPSAAAHPRRQTTSQAERGGGNCSAPTPRGKPGAKRSENGHKSPKAALSWVLPPPQARRCGLLTPFVFPSSREARRLPVRHRLDGRYLF